MPHEVRNTQLDALRCVAVLLVLWDHAGPRGGPQLWGDAGVRLFFVLSAFLITGILLRLRDGGVATGTALKTFYQRRALRILPPYLVLLGALLALGVPTVRRDLATHLLYLSNWRFIEVPWRPPLGHLWSLSVEEQFYLLWPLLVLLCARRLLPWIFGAAMLSSVAARPLVMALGFPTKAAMLVTPASFDALGLGALLAWHLHTHRDEEALRRRVADRCLAAGVLTIASYLLGARWGIDAPEWAMQAVEQLGGSLVALWCVQRCAAGVTGRGEKLLEARPVVYVGRISYGIYLVQTPICFAFTTLSDGKGIFAGSVAFFALATACSIAVAAASWRWLEAPMNRLKERVPYPAPRQPRLQPLAPQPAHATSL